MDAVSARARRGMRVALTVCVKELPWGVAVDSDVGVETDDFPAPFWGCFHIRTAASE